ncbi:MAG TPA: Rieske 2Fe-2S domain-containing protein [Solirubrobacteraceae bacterium]
MKPWQWLVALLTMLRRRARRPRGGGSGPDIASGATAPPSRERIVPAGAPDRRAENLVLVLLGTASLFALGFIVVYDQFSSGALPDQLLGICLGMCLLCIGGALTVVAKRLVVTEELEDDYPEADPEQQQEIVEMIHEGGSRFTRKRLLLGAGAATGGALGLAAMTPLVSIGPLWDTGPLDRTPWHRGLRVVDEHGAPMVAADVDMQTFYTGFPEGANMEDLGAPVVIIRLDPAKLELPAGREDWAPGGILAYSKICTHAGCAIGLYRNPLFPALEPNNALVCPCHYSTFDPYTGASVIYGPAGRPLPQLPLMIGTDGYLRASGNFSGRVGPAWWAVREQPT